MQLVQTPHENGLTFRIFLLDKEERRFFLNHVCQWPHVPGQILLAYIIFGYGKQLFVKSSAGRITEKKKSRKSSVG